MNSISPSSDFHSEAMKADHTQEHKRLLFLKLAEEFGGLGLPNSSLVSLLSRV